MDVKRIIKDFVLQELAEDGFREEIQEDDSLIDSGILDSLNILKLLCFMDEKFKIMPDEHEIYPENFDSINHIYNFIDEKLKK